MNIFSMKKIRKAGAYLSIVVAFAGMNMLSIKANAAYATRTYLFYGYNCDCGTTLSSTQVSGYMTATKTPSATTDTPYGGCGVSAYDSTNSIVGSNYKSGNAVGGYLVLGPRSNLSNTPVYSISVVGIENDGDIYYCYY